MSTPCILGSAALSVGCVLQVVRNIYVVLGVGELKRILFPMIMHIEIYIV